MFNAKKQTEFSMKKWSVLFLLVVSQTLLFAQSHRAIELNSSWEGRDLVYGATNNDYCDYFLSVDLSKTVGYQRTPSPYTATIGRGSSSLFTLKRDGYASPSTNITYRHYRGNPDKKINIDFLYALPIKTGDSTRVIPKKMIAYTLRFTMQHTSDTVYACRGGIVCNDDIYDTSAKGYKKPEKILTIYHNDGSMAEYTAFTVPLVYAGESVEMGDPIAISQKGNRSVSEVQVGFFFLDKNKLELKTGNRHTHFSPLFSTAGREPMKLEAKTTYISAITEEMLMQDMSKREKKKYLNKKKK